MKLAILGGSPFALEAAMRFHLHGGALTWFQHDGESKATSWEESTSSMGWSLIKSEPKGAFSHEEWMKQYHGPLCLLLRSEQEIKNFEVVSITKRFLAPMEEIPGKSRFHDLFRIIYVRDPREFIESQKESDPEMFKRLNEELVQSLQSKIELYEDFDLVVDLRLPIEPRSASVTGRALGEARISSPKMKRGVECVGQLNLESIFDIALIGSGELALHTLLNLSSWLKDPRHTLFVITPEESPFDKILPHLKTEVVRQYETLMRELESEYNKETTEFQAKLREWQALDDFVQAKISKPVEPIPRLNFFSGHNLTAIDQLIDREKFFLTLEKPDFRNGKKHPENNHVDLKTIGCDLILSANGVEKKKISEFSVKEKGYWSYVPHSPWIKQGWETDLLLLKGIENEIFKLFSPLHPH